MRALVVCPDSPPTPTSNTGGHVRLGMFMRTLAALGAEVDMLFFMPEALVPDAAGLQALTCRQARHWGMDLRRVRVAPLQKRRPPTLRSHYLAPLASAHAHHFYRSFSGAPQVEAVRECLADRPDVVIVQYLAAMLPLLRSGLRPRGVLFDLCDVDHKAGLRAALAPPWRPGKLAYAAHTPAIHFAERQGAALADATLVAAEADRRYLSALGVPRLQRVPNAVRLPAAPAPLPPEPTLLFLGSFNHPPNLAAVAWLVQSIWPRVKAKIPHARLLIAGQPTANLPPACHDDGSIEVLGFVPDLAALYARARVVCCPVLAGGGTRLKLIEAAAHGKPMVATRIGAEGLGLRHGREILIADSAPAFAAACIEHLAADATCARFGAAARSHALQHFDAAATERTLAQLIATAAAAPRGRSRRPESEYPEILSPQA